MSAVGIWRVFGMYLGDIEDHEIGTTVASSALNAMNRMDEIVNDFPIISSNNPYLWITRAVPTVSVENTITYQDWSDC